MSAAWAIKDSEGLLVIGLSAASRTDLGRKVLPKRYDPFRLHVSASFREMFERDLNRLLAQKGWQIVRVKPSQRASRIRHDFAEYREAA